MEKEQKKLLLVAVSVGVFLLVTITVAIVLLTSKTQIQEAASYTANPFQPAGNVQSVESISYPQPAITNTQETNINLDFENAETAAAIDSNDRNNLTIQIPRPNAAAVPDTPETASNTATVVSIVSRPSVESASSSAAKNTSAVQPARSTTNTPAVQPVRTTASSITINDYWIQTGSFTAKIRADDAKEFLESKGLTSIIENREINGNTWYRVRLGPYTSENEANYWLALVQSIDGFGGSQVWQSPRQQ